MKNKIAPLLSILSLFVTVTLLVVTIFTWYATNEEAKASGVEFATEDVDSDFVVTFNTGDDKVDVHMIPGSFSCLKINVATPKSSSASLQFLDPKVEWKSIVTEYKALASGTPFESNVYYDSGKKLVETKPEDWDASTTSYLAVTDNVVTYEEAGEKSSMMPLERLYGINSYYVGTSVESCTKTLLSLGTKRAEFLKLYKDNDKVNMADKITVYASATAISPADYETELKPLVESEDFKPISNTTIEYPYIDSGAQSMYLYFYFDSTDEYFNTSGDNYFYGQNPYFLQTISLNLIIVK